MKISFRTRYLVFIALLHLVITGLAYWVLKEHKLFFLLAEVLILVSVYVAVRIYRQFEGPAQFISAGIEAIKDKDFTIKFVQTGNREVDQLIDVYNLMIDQLRQERTRQMEGQFFLEKLVEASPIAILIFDLDGRIASVNSKACALLEAPREALVGQSPEAAHPMLNQMQHLEDGASQRIKGKGVQTYRAFKSHFMDRGFRRHFLMIEELTAEILETEKKSYGKVIRMMAHEVNNSIGAINSIIDVTHSSLPAPDYDDIRHALRVASERNDRLNRFMRRFADVVRLPLPHKVPNDLGDLVGNVTQLMKHQAEAAGVRLAYFSPAEPVAAALDRDQLEQVLVNVLKNAVEACRPGEEVEVHLGPHRLAVRDNGRPIPDAIAADLFNPFFSTKPDGQGIGLTLTREILLNHGFSFSLKTNPDGWTEFVVNLSPATQ